MSSSINYYTRAFSRLRPNAKFKPRFSQDVNVIKGRKYKIKYSVGRPDRYGQFRCPLKVDFDRTFSNSCLRITKGSSFRNASGHENHSKIHVAIF